MSDITLGIDLGSRSVKLAWREGSGDTYELRTYDSLAFYREYTYRKKGEIEIDFGKLDVPHFSSVVATGYGRYAGHLANAEYIGEINAHTLGAAHFTGYDEFTLIDIGGQDAKVVTYIDNEVRDFQTNDRCAASSGRYLENMANILAISLEELAEHWENPSEITSTCAIFGESEVIGKLIEGEPMKRIAAGINLSVIRRVLPAIRKMPSKHYVLTGGVARSSAVHHLLETHVSSRITISPHPQHVGAIGCIMKGKSPK